MTTRLIAHRGEHSACPENTVEAFEAAVRGGADAVELDVHATSDSVIVVHHDSVLWPGLSGRDSTAVPISTLSHADLRSYYLPGGFHIPTLNEVLTTLNGRTHVHVEVKGSGIEAQVVQCIDASGVSASVHAFDHRVVKRCRETNSRLEGGVLLYSRLLDPLNAMNRADALDLWQFHEFVDEELTDQVHAAGKRIIAWTVNDAATARRFIDMGVDGLCTDRVEMMRRIIDEMNGP